MVEKNGSVHTDIQHKMGCCREMTDNGKQIVFWKIQYWQLYEGFIVKGWPLVVVPMYM